MDGMHWPENGFCFVFYVCVLCRIESEIFYRYLFLCFAIPMVNNSKFTGNWNACRFIVWHKFMRIVISFLLQLNTALIESETKKKRNQINLHRLYNNGMGPLIVTLFQHIWSKQFLRFIEVIVRYAPNREIVHLKIQITQIREPVNCDAF